MRLTPIILIALGLWGMLQPEMLTELEASNGRIVAAIILLLGLLTLWRVLRRR